MWRARPSLDGPALAVRSEHALDLHRSIGLRRPQQPFNLSPKCPCVGYHLFRFGVAREDVAARQEPGGVDPEVAHDARQEIGQRVVRERWRAELDQRPQVEFDYAKLSRCHAKIGVVPADHNGAHPRRDVTHFS